MTVTEEEEPRNGVTDNSHPENGANESITKDVRTLDETVVLGVHDQIRVGPNISTVEGVAIETISPEEYGSSRESENPIVNGTPSSQDVESAAVQSIPNAERTTTNQDGERVVVALPLNEDQLIYEARQERDDPCCTVVVWWLRPILAKLATRENLPKTLFVLAVVIVAIVLGVVYGTPDRPSETIGPIIEDIDLNASLSEAPTAIQDVAVVPSASPSAASSSAPSTAEAFERIQNITKIIEEASSNDLFNDPSTSQGKALQWILHEDELRVESSYPTLKNRYALMVLFNALGGEKWLEKTGYGTEPGNFNLTHECDWFGVECDEETKETIGLRITNNGLSGTIPEEISFFSELEKIELFQNNIGGTVPESVYSLESLKRFYTYGNILEGTLSPAIGNLKNLTHLSIRTNKFGGPIPSEIGELENLAICRLYSNNFTGPFPGFLGNNKKLLVINFGDNKLSGPLSPNIGNLTLLKNLYFYDNFFTGTVPKEWGGLVDLRRTGMWNNQLVGTFPSEFTSLPNLIDLSIGDNQLTGHMPYADGLEELWIYNNQFSGTIPPGIGNMKTLKLLSAWKNNLNGTIPEEIGNLTSIITLKLNQNQLSGQIPNSIENLDRAITIDISENELTGEVPASIASLPVLNSLSLHSNNFTGIIPAEVCENSMNRLSSDCMEIECACCTCCYGEGGALLSGEC